MKLIQEIDWFIDAVEYSIRSELEFIHSLNVQLAEIEKDLRRLLEQKKKEVMKKKRNI